MLDLSIIIVNWNTRDLLAQCLESVYANTQGITFEVFVVDNASADGSAQMVPERFPQVRLIENQENVGFARANNQAIKEARGRYVLFLNSDTVVQPSALNLMVAFMDNHLDAGAAGAMLLNSDGTLQKSTRNKFSIGEEILSTSCLGQISSFFPLRSSAGTMGHAASNRYIMVDGVAGTCLLARRATLDDVGPFNEQFFMYAEDNELCFRIRRNNWKIYYLPSARVIHHGGRSTAQASQQMLLEFYRARFLFYRLVYAPTSVFVLKGILITELLFKIGFWSIVCLVTLAQLSQVRQKLRLSWTVLRSAHRL